MKLRTYNGTIKNRKDLEDILGRNPLVRIGEDRLSKTAKVIFAIGSTRSFPSEWGGHPTQRQDVLSFWMNGPKDVPAGRFFSCHSLRAMIPHEMTGEQRIGPWKHRITQVNPQEALKGLQMNYDERVSGNAEGTERWPAAFRNVENIGSFNSLKDALREVYAIMVQMEADYSGTHAAQVDADVVLASERFQGRRN